VSLGIQYYQRNHSELATVKMENQTTFNTMCGTDVACLHCFDAVGWMAGRASGL